MSERNVVIVLHQFSVVVKGIEKKLLEFYLKGGDFSEKIVPMAKILGGLVKDRRGEDAEE